MRVLLEGPAIEPLLAQVREEYGSGVRIISADKVRSGGFGGFFAKQHYELSVEVPDNSMDERNEMTSRRPSPSSVGELMTVRAQEPPAQTLTQLIERAESRDRVLPDRVLPDRVLPDRVLPDMPGHGPADRAVARSAGVGDTEAAFGRRDPAETGTAFAELMAGLDRSGDATGGTGSAWLPKSKAEGQTVRPFRPARATGQPVNGGGAVKPPPPVPSLAELMGGLGMSDTDAIAVDQALSRTGPPRNAAEAYGAVPPAVPPAQPPTVHAMTALRPINDDPVVMNLVSVGMPKSMAAEITGGDTYAGVLSALARRPAAPEFPAAPGEILVLAGDLAHLVPISKQMLQQNGLDQGHLLLVGPSSAGTGLHSSRVMHTPAQAAARAEKMQSADSAWVVMLDAPVGNTDPIWVSDICEALAPTAVWAVVDATRKTADSAKHLRALGDVEALVVHNVELTSDPATTLGLDLPIVSLDGKPATPHAWAAMLCARIAADVTPMAATPRRAPRAGR